MKFISLIKIFKRSLHSKWKTYSLNFLSLKKIQLPSIATEESVTPLILTHCWLVQQEDSGAIIFVPAESYKQVLRHSLRSPIYTCHILVNVMHIFKNDGIIQVTSSYQRGNLSKLVSETINLSLASTQ